MKYEGLDCVMVIDSIYDVQSFIMVQHPKFWNAQQTVARL